jgi:hypothetical protein
MPLLLEPESTGSGLNITTEQALDTYQASGAQVVIALVSLSGLNGAAATLSCWLKHTLADDTVVGYPDATSKIKKAATDTMAGFRALGPVYLADGEKAVVSVLSTNASDTAAVWKVRWVDAAWASNMVGAAPSAADNGVAAAAAILAVPDNKLVTNEGGQVEASNAPEIDAQVVRDAMKLAPSAGAPDAGSVDALIGAIPTTAAPTAAENRAEMDANSTRLEAIEADTNELQTDLANGGRLDLLIDAIKAKTDLLDNAVATFGDDHVTVRVRIAGVAIAGMRVWVSSDAAGANHTFPKTTNDLGEALFMLTAGSTYYLWGSKAGVNPISGQSFEATAD